MDKIIEKRFWSYVKKTPTCWEWTGHLFQNGYGGFHVAQNKKVRTHRYSYKISIGEIPEGLLVCHTCDNRKCVRPSHLFIGTHRDNSLDMMKKGRSKSAGLKGEESPYHKLTDEIVRKIRMMYQDGMSQTEIGRIFGVNKTAISKVILRQNWAHVI